MVVRATAALGTPRLTEFCCQGPHDPQNRREANRCSISDKICNWPIATSLVGAAQVSSRRQSRRDLLCASIAARDPDVVGAVHRAPSDYPSGKAGNVLTVEFTVAGVACIDLNGGPAFKHNEAFSFQIATDDQDETDRYCNAIVGNGGQEIACGWCKDKWGVSWQITPRVLTEALAAGGDEAKRAFDAMMGMRKIDVATIKAARRG
jgi:predicted 3-demethylubiquinone-9 3-methyltransferase (glyoxalase superfamily)